eukprot:3835822-Lingulodinium_polyedra.AAC.1
MRSSRSSTPRSRQSCMKRGPVHRRKGKPRVQAHRGLPTAPIQTPHCSQRKLPDNSYHPIQVPGSTKTILME